MFGCVWLYTYRERERHTHTHTHTRTRTHREKGSGISNKRLCYSWCMFVRPLLICQYTSVEMYMQHLFCWLFQQSKERRYNITLWHFFVILTVLRHPNSLIPFHLKSVLIWWFNVTVNNKMYWGLHVKCPILTKFRVSQEICMKVPNVKFHWNLSSRYHTQADGLTYDEANRCC
jgi:hypothetical protein